MKLSKIFAGMSAFALAASIMAMAVTADEAEGAAAGSDASEYEVAIDLSKGSNPNVEDGVLTLSAAKDPETEELLVEGSNVTQIKLSDLEQFEGKVVGVEFDCEAPFTEAGWVGGGGGIGYDGDKWTQVDFSVDTSLEGDTWHESLTFKNAYELNWEKEDGIIQIGWWWGAGDTVKISNFKLILEQPEELGFDAHLIYISANEDWSGQNSVVTVPVYRGENSITFKPLTDGSDAASDPVTAYGTRVLVVDFVDAFPNFDWDNGTVEVTKIEVNGEEIEFTPENIRYGNLEDDTANFRFDIVNIWGDHAEDTGIPADLEFDEMTIYFNVDVEAKAPVDESSEVEESSATEESSNTEESKTEESSKNDSSSSSSSSSSTAASSSSKAAAGTTTTNPNTGAAALAAAGVALAGAAVVVSKKRK